MRWDSNEEKQRGSRRRWPLVVLGCLAFVVLLAGLAPRIASIGPVRNMLLSRLNARLAPATLSVDDWSLRWFGPIAITGLHFTDPDKGLDFRIAKLGSANGLAAMLPIGKVNPGAISVTAPHMLVRLPHTQKKTTAQMTSSANQAPSGGPVVGVKHPFALSVSDLAVKLVVQDGRIEVVGTGAQPFVLEHLDLTAEIESLRDPVAVTFTTLVPYGDNAGRVALKGTLPRPEFFLMGGTTTTEHLTLDASKLDLRSLRPLLESFTGQPWIRSGLANGKIALDYRGQESLQLKTDLTIAELSVEPPGKPLAPAGNVSVQADLSYVAGRLTITQLACASPWMGVQAAGQFAVQTDANGRRTGEINAQMDTDLVALTRDFGSLLKLNDNFLVERGKAHMQVVLAGTTESMEAMVNLTTDNLMLRSGNEVFAMQPSPTMKLNLAWPYTQPPEARELLIDLPFARISGKGRLDDATLKAHVDLAALSKNLRSMLTNCPEMQGVIDVDVKSHKDGDRMAAGILVTASNVAAELQTGRRLTIGSARLTASAKVPLLNGMPSREASDVVFAFESAAGSISGSATRLVPASSSNRPPLIAGGQLKIDLDLEAARNVAAPLLTQLPPDTVISGKANMEVALTGTTESMEAMVNLTTDNLALRSRKEVFSIQPSPSMRLNLFWQYAQPPEIRELLVALPFARLSGKGRLDDATLKANVDLTALSRDFRRMVTNCPNMRGLIDVDVKSHRDGDGMVAGILVTASNVAAELQTGPSLTLGSGSLTASAKVPLVNGKLAFEAQCTTNHQGVAATLNAVLDQFSFTKASNQPFSEPHAELAIKAGLSADASRLTLDALSLKSSLAEFDAKGWIADLQKQRLTDLSGTMAVDFDKLNQLLRAQGLPYPTLAGRQARPFAISGPLAGNTQKLLPQVQAKAALYLESAAGFGLAAGPADIGMTLNNGVMRLNYAPTLNQGTLQLAPSVDATANPLALSLPPGTSVLQNVQLTQEMLDQVLVLVLPLLRGSSVLGGSVDLTMQDCYVPLGETLKRDMTFSALLTLRNVHLAPAGILGTLFQLAGLGGKELTIRQHQLTANCINGRVTPSPLVLFVEGNKVKLTGTVGLDGTLAYTVEVPLSKTLVGKEAEKYLEGAMINVPIAGTVKTPTIDRTAMNAEIKRLVSEALKKAAVEKVGDLLKNLKF